MRTFGTSFWFTLLTLFTCSAVSWGAITTGEAEGTLQVRPEASSAALLNQTQILFRQAQQIYNQVAEARTRNSLSTSEALKLGAAFVRAKQATRVGGHLFERGEAAGPDWQVRGRNLRDEIERLAKEVKPALRDFPTAKITAEFEATKRAGQARLPAIEKQIAAGQILEAERAVLEITDALDSYSIWYGNPVEYYRPFSAVSSATLGPASKLREQAYEVEALPKCNQQVPDFAKFLADAKRVTEELQQTGEASWENEKLKGPQALLALTEALRKLQLELLRRSAWEATFRKGADTPARPEMADLAEQWSKFLLQAKEALVIFVETDANRVPAAEVGAVYKQYLLAVVEVIQCFPNAEQDSLSQRFQPALEKLVARNADWKREVSHYRQATSELVRWRKMVVQREAHPYSQRSTPTGTLYAQGAQVSGTYPGFHPTRFSSSTSATGVYATTVVLPSLTKRSIGEPTYVVNVNSPLGMGRCITRENAHLVVRVQLPTGPKLWAHQEVVKQVFYTHGDAQPLTLPAMFLVNEVRQNGYAKIGGTLAAVTIESYLARQTQLDQLDAEWLDIAPLAESELVGDMRAQLFIRAEVIEPTWVQTPLFVTDLR